MRVIGIWIKNVLKDEEKKARGVIDHAQHTKIAARV